MTRLFEIYGKIARPWLTLVVYLWILELLATFSDSRSGAAVRSNRRL